MIELIRELPENVLAAKAVGKVTAEDYETVLIPEVETRLKDHNKLSLLYVLGDEFAGFEAGAMWEDTKVGLMHLTAWERIAVVSDSQWVRGAVKAFARRTSRGSAASRRKPPRTG